MMRVKKMTMTATEEKCVHVCKEITIARSEKYIQ
jgi:hypothetical protein